MTLPAPAIVTVGPFDGLHRGHLEVIATLEETAAGLGLAPLLITFANHPLDVVAPARAPKLLMPPEEKKEALRALPVRSEMLRFYYHSRETGKIRQYEYENFVMLYEAYKALKGNSFIDKIYKEIQELEIVT